MGFSTTTFALTAFLAGGLMLGNLTLANATDIKKIMGGAKDKAACEQNMTAQVNSPSQYLSEQWETDHKNPCPTYDNSGSAEVTCKEIVGELEKAMGDWLKAHKDHCKLLDKESNCKQNKGQTGCMEDISEKLAAANESVRREKEKVLAVITKFESNQKKMAEGVSKIPPKSNLPPARMQSRSKLDANQIASFAQKIAEGKVSESDISRTNDKLVQEPLVVAEMMQEVKKQLHARDKKLNTTSGELNKNSGINSGNAKDNSSLTKGVGNSNTGSTASEAAKAASGLAAPAAGLAQAAGGGGGSGSGATAGGGTDYGSLGTGNGSTAGTESYRKNSPAGSSAVPLQGSSKSNNGRATNQPAEAIDLSSKVAELQAGESEEYNTSGGSSSQSLKDSLRAKLGKGGGSSNAAAESTGASAAAGGSGGGSGKSTAGASGSHVAPLAGYKSEDVFAGLGGGGGSLGGGESFDLAGSETDAYVKSMVGSLSAELGDDEGSRSLASMETHEEGVLEENTESLFLRTRSTLVRSVKRGNLVTNLRSKL